MTKIVKWYKRTKFWNAFIAILTPIASGEVVAFFANITLPTWVHVVVGICAAILLYVKAFRFHVDENNNGISDKFEDKK